MTERDRIEGTANEEPTDGSEVAAPQQPGVEDLAALRDELSAAESKAAENLDGWQRALAEFQNYRKRVERDRGADQAAMKADMIRKLLPLLDDLERALKNRPEADAWASGIELIQRKFQAFLDAEGVTRIEAEGEPFDPNFHEALAQEPVEGIENGRIVAIIQHGYMLGDRVIRPAQVRVAA